MQNFFFDKIQNKSMFLIFAFCQKQQYFSIRDFFKFYPVPQKQPQLWSKSTHRNVSPHFRNLRPRPIKQNMFWGAENSQWTSNMALKLIDHVYLSWLYLWVLDHFHAKNSHTKYQGAQLLENPPKTECNTIQNDKSLSFGHFVSL